MLDSTKDHTLHIDGDRVWLTFPKLDGYDELRHLFTTRHGGVSTGYLATWNFGVLENDKEENIRRNYEILAETMGTTPDRFIRTNQTHTDNILIVSEEDAGKGVTRERGFRDVDGLVTSSRGIALMTTHADCNAVFFYDPVKHVIGMAHSGWRGTLKSISTRMTDIMGSEFGSSSRDIVAGIGPSLCKDCFEVDPDVAEAFIAKDPENAEFIEERAPKFHIDLKLIIRRDLLRCGLKEENILDMKLCTMCDTENFFSHRGQHGKRGLMAASIMMK